LDLFLDRHLLVLVMSLLDSILIRFNVATTTTTTTNNVQAQTQK
jgi:hypothetical protein